MLLCAMDAIADREEAFSSICWLELALNEAEGIDIDASSYPLTTDSLVCPALGVGTPALRVPLKICTSSALIPSLCSKAVNFLLVKGSVP